MNRLPRAKQLLFNLLRRLISSRRKGLPIHRRFLCAAVAVALPMAGLCLRAQAARGDLDMTFGLAGKVHNDFGGYDNSINCITLQPDGKILVGGGISNDFGLARYQRDGSLDTTFGNGGSVSTPLPGPAGYNVGAVTAMVLQSDGKIVVAGTSISNYEYNTDFAVARYNSDGSPDTAFGVGGILVTDFFGEYDLANAVALQSDGKIVVAGSANKDGGTGESFALARYNDDGSPDASFGVDGKVVNDFFKTLKRANALAIQPDGKLIVAGYGEFNQSGDFALARFNSDGSLDATFGFKGVMLTRFPSGGSEATSLALQPNGQIVVAGFANNRLGTNSDFALARYDRHGFPDRAFNKTGRVTIDFRGDVDNAYAVGVLPDGMIVISGYAQKSETDSDFALARLDKHGKLDKSFGDHGKVMTDFSGLSTDSVHAMAIQPDGDIIAAGSTSMSGTMDFALARYNR